MILLFDTSTPAGLLLVGYRGQVLSSATWTAEQSHSQKLAPQIQIALEMAGITTSDVTHVAVGIGPGSFTGLRVALATAKGLGIALGVPLVALPSLVLFAAGRTAGEGNIAATSDAFRGELYLGIYEASGAELSLVGEIRSLTPERAIDAIRALGRPVTLTGTGYQRYQGLFDTAFPPSPPQEFAWAGLLRLAEHAIQEGRISTPAEVLPLYVREAEAVEKQKRQ